MSYTAKETIKLWFKRGLKPLGSQFAVWIDSFWHKSETIPQESVENLVQSLNSKANAVELPTKVDKVEGKGLSTNDYTTEDLQKLQSLHNYDDTAINKILVEKADLVNGKVPASQLPAYIDEVVEKPNYAALPIPGTGSIIYVTIDDNKEYRWSGTNYRELVSSPGTTDAIIEGNNNKYFTENRALSTLLTGISFIVNGAVTSADSILVAIGKLQTSKVDKVAGKGLSTNDYTTEDQQKLAGLNNYDDSGLNSLLDSKVDKVAGKGLSTNDYTTEDQQKLAGLNNYDDSGLAIEIFNKVDKIAGKGLSTNDFTNDDKTAVSEIIASITNAINALKDNVPIEGDSLKKLYDNIQTLKSLLASDDVNLDTIQEIITFIKNNKDVIDSISTNKVNKIDIVDSLLSNDSQRPLSANQGSVIKALIDAMTLVIANKVNANGTDRLVKLIEVTQIGTNQTDITALKNSAKRGFSFNDSATLGADYYPAASNITAINVRNIVTLEYSLDGTNYTALAIPGGLPLAVAAGDLYWRITYSAGKTQAFLDITGTKS